jgi:hypothetical protein
LELREKELVKTSGSFPKASRRAVLAGLGAVALPLVVSMTMGQQRAMAAEARSTVDPDPSCGKFDDRPTAHVSHTSGDRF